jgi:hypothetical protein
MQECCKASLRNAMPIALFYTDAFKRAIMQKYMIGLALVSHERKLLRRFLTSPIVDDAENSIVHAKKVKMLKKEGRTIKRLHDIQDLSRVNFILDRNPSGA